jgi:hypothetical protein
MRPSLLHPGGEDECSGSGAAVYPEVSKNIGGDMVIRLTRRELVELINSMEANDRDTAHLRALLASLPVEQASQKLSPFRDEELSTVDYLNLKVGDLFPNRVDDDVLAQLIAIDGQYSLSELKAMCRQAGLSTSGDKKILAAKLLAGGFIKKEEKMESKEWTAEPNEELRIPAEYLTGLKYEVVILSSRKDFAPLKCKRYERQGQVVTLYDVIWDTSKRNARREIIQQVVSWHEKIELLNIGCIIIPIPEIEVVSPPQAD